MICTCTSSILFLKVDDIELEHLNASGTFGAPEVWADVEDEAKDSNIVLAKSRMKNGDDFDMIMEFAPFLLEVRLQFMLF